MSAHLEARLLRLERRLRVQRALSIGVVALAAVLGLAGWQKPLTQMTQKVQLLSVHRLEVTDLEGRVVFRIGHTPTGGYMQVLGTSGGNVAELAATRSGPHFSMNGWDGRPRVRMSAAGPGGQLELMRLGAQPAIALGVTATSAEVALKDKGNRSICSLRTDEDGNGEVEIMKVEDRTRRRFGF